MDEPDGGVEDVGIAPPGFRMPADLRLGPVVLQVADLGRSVEYYRRVIGLEALREDGGVVRMGGADGTPLVELEERPGASPVPRRGRLGLYHFALLLPGRAALGAFLGHLAGLGLRPGTADHSVSEALYLTDPDGLGIEIYADRPRSQWRRHGRELQMTTDPLDVAGVLAAAAEPWAGMPAGSTMGHLHLFVGDLDAASAFYHRGLGLDRMVWSYPGALFMAGGGYHHHLGTNTWAAGAPPAGAADARLIEWRLLLPDEASVRAAAESVAAAGSAVEWDGAGWTATDPWGTKLRVGAG
jgi:catechol 2,3-dioxygenase